MFRTTHVAFRYFESVLGRKTQTMSPVSVSPMKAVEVLWQLNDVFRSNLSQFKALPYDPKFETAADLAIEKFAKNPTAETWSKLPAKTWRVLLERYVQMLLVGLAADKKCTPVLTILPVGLPQHAELPGLMLLLLHSRKLPYPPQDRTDYELPSENVPGNLQLR